MSTWVYLPLVLTAVFGVAAPAAAKSLPPSAGGMLAAAGSAASLALLAFVLIAQTPVLAAKAGWSEGVLRGHDPVAPPIAILAAVTLVVLAGRFLRTAAHRLVAVHAAARLAAALPAIGGELAVIDIPDREAFAVPGRPGRIVLTTGLLRSLDAAQRRALLAHERAHLRHRHHIHHTAAHLAAAANPLLARIPAIVELSCERWADEDAALLSRRDTVADALTRAAIRTTHTAPAVVLAAAASDVLVRVAALHAPQARLSRWRVGLMLGLLAASTVAVAVAMRDTERLFELARHAYRAGQR